jgi:hypothetical protein
LLSAIGVSFRLRLVELLSQIHWAIFSLRPEAQLNASSSLSQHTPTGSSNPPLHRAS